MRNKLMLIASLALAAAVFGGCSTSAPAKPDNRTPAQKAEDHRQFKADEKWMHGHDDPVDRYDQDPSEGCQYVVSC
jgi:PBP1b-binding outer membrane lipoprotein LpoB